MSPQPILGPDPAACREDMPRALDWTTDEQAMCCCLLRDLFRGWHHVGVHRVKPSDSSGISYTHLGELSTFDSNDLTRLVILAHDRAIRASVGSCNPSHMTLRLHVRTTRVGDIMTRHPSLEGAAEIARATNLGRGWSRTPASTAA